MSENEKNEMIKLLKVSPKVVGSKQVSRGISEGTIGCVIVAEDAERGLKKRLVTAATEAGLRVLTAPNVEWLGRNAGIEVGAAAVGIERAGGQDTDCTCKG